LVASFNPRFSLRILWLKIPVTEENTPDFQLKTTPQSNASPEKQQNNLQNKEIVALFNHMGCERP
jgi:hypothetical protein